MTEPAYTPTDDEPRLEVHVEEGWMEIRVVPQIPANSPEPIAREALQVAAKAIADRVHGEELRCLRKATDGRGDRAMSMMTLFDAAVKAGIADVEMTPSEMERAVAKHLHPALAVRYLIELRAAILADLANTPMREDLRNVFDTVSRFLGLPEWRNLPCP